MIILRQQTSRFIIKSRTVMRIRRDSKNKRDLRNTKITNECIIIVIIIITIIDLFQTNQRYLVGRDF